MEQALEIKEQELQAEGTRIVQEAEDFKVKDDLTCQEAADRTNAVKSRLDAALEFFRPMKEAAHKTWKAICDREKNICGPYEAAKRIYTSKAAAYVAEKREEAEEKERKAKEEAERREREEKARLEKEAREKAAQAKKLAQEAKQLRKEASDLKRQGKEAAAAGKIAEAEKKEEEALALDKNVEILREQKQDVYIPPKPVAPAIAPAGISVQMVWVPEVVDEKKVPTKWWTEIDLGRLKRAKTADPTLQVPGIRFVQKAQGAALGVRK